MPGSHTNKKATVIDVRDFYKLLGGLQRALNYINSDGGTLNEQQVEDLNNIKRTMVSKYGSVRKFSGKII